MSKRKRSKGGEGTNSVITVIIIITIINNNNTFRYSATCLYSLVFIGALQQTAKDVRSQNPSHTLKVNVKTGVFNWDLKLVIEVASLNSRCRAFHRL